MAKSINSGLVRNPLMMRSRAFNMGWSAKGINKTVSGRFVGFNALPTAGLIGQFDETSIVGDNVVTEWQNKGTFGAAFDLDTVVGTAANLTKMGNGVARLPGAIGDNFTTPDTALASVTSDIDIRWFGALEVYNGITQDLVSKWVTGTQSYALRAQNNQIRALISVDGTSTILAQSDVHAFIPGDVAGLRFTRVAATGEFIFYTSTDGISWTPIGIPVAGAAGDIFDSAEEVEIGTINGGSNPAKGFARYAAVLAGIDGPYAVNFDPPSATASASPWVDAKTGATWTPNGTAFVNATGQAVVYSSGGVRIETLSALNIIAPPMTVFLAFKATMDLVQDNVAAAKADTLQSLTMFVSATDNFRMNGGAGFGNIPGDDLPHIWTVQQNGDVTSGFEISGLGSAVGDMGAESWQFGGLFGGEANSFPMDNGWIGEALVYDRALSIAEIEQVQGYLGSKWL